MNQEILDEVLVVIITTFTVRFKHIKESSLMFEDNIKEKTKGDIKQTSEAILDIHKLLGLPIEHEPLTEYETFETFSDLTSHIYHSLLNLRNHGTI